MTLCLLCGAKNKNFDPECGHADAQTPIENDYFDANGEPKVEDEDPTPAMRTREECVEMLEDLSTYIAASPEQAVGLEASKNMLQWVLGQLN